MYTKIISREQTLELIELGMEMKKLGITERYVAIECGIEDDFIYPSIAEVLDWAFKKFNIFLGIKIGSNKKYSSEITKDGKIYRVIDNISDLEELLIASISEIIDFIPSINP